LPYRKAAEVMAEFLPIQSTESFVMLRRRTLKLGQRLDERARERAWFEPASTAERRQIELSGAILAWEFAGNKISDLRKIWCLGISI
jgi:hypothetical protein